jgi:hypothetical protein
MKIFKTDPNAIAFLETFIIIENNVTWKQRTVGYTTSSMRTNGTIFHRGRLGPLCFCLTLPPLNRLFKQATYGYEVFCPLPVPLTNSM